MKKFLVVLFSLFCTSAYAGTISIPPFISGNDVTIIALENQRTAISNVINGNIEGGTNIKAGSIVSQDMSASVSTVTRWDESFSDFTYSGMLPVTSASLTSNISAGTSYIDGYRIVTASTAHTYTASKDTYVYIHNGGYFVFQEVANGASAPTTPVNTLLLAKVVSSGTALTAVTDLRTTSIQITATTSNFPTNYRDQAYVSRDTTVNFYVTPGNIAIGTSIYTKTANTTTKSIITGTNWIEGSYPTGYNGLVFIYGYNDSGSTYDFKFSSADVAYSDTSLNTAGIKKYYVSGGVNYRALGWAYLSSDTVQSYATSNVRDMGVPNGVYYTSTTSFNTASTTFVNDNGALAVKFYSSGGMVRIQLSAANASSASDGVGMMVSIDGSELTEAERWGGISNTTTTNKMSCYFQWFGVISRGMHTIQIKARAVSGTGYVNARSIIVEEM